MRCHGKLELGVRSLNLWRGHYVLMSWRTAEGAMIAYTRVDDFFIDTCRRVGYEPHFRRTWFSYGRPAWDVSIG